MTTNGNNHGGGSDPAADDDFNSFTYELEEPITVKGFSVTYDRKFNTGNFESLAPSITIWVKTNAPEGKVFDLHHAKERVRRMARENVRAQLLRLQDSPEVVFLGLQPPLAGGEDPIFIRTVSVSLVHKANLGNNQSITPGFTDWADLRHVAHSPGELHVALDRMWQSLWANVADEVSRAQGQGGTGGFFGLPAIVVEDLTAAAAAPPVDERVSPTNRSASANGRSSAANGRSSAANGRSSAANGRSSAANGSRV
ncbi:MAG: hypothetical protein R6X34_23275 [Chloroflexota bacterium]